MRAREAAQTVSEPLSAVRFRSAFRAHASCVNEFLGPMINLPAACVLDFRECKASCVAQWQPKAAAD